MVVNWRIHKTASFVIIAFTIAALLGFAINLEDKVLNTISWRMLLAIGQGYVAWTFKRLINY
jgi:hypothetical protein